MAVIVSTVFASIGAAVEGLSAAAAGATVATGVGELSGLAAGTGYAVGSTGAAAASASAGGGLLSFLQPGLTALSILSGVASGTAALASYGRGVADQTAKNAQADMYEQRAITEGLIDANDAVKAQRALVDTLGKQAVGYAASGIDLSAGTVKIAQRQASEKAEDDLSVAETTSNIRQASYRRQAAALRAEGSLAYAAGQIGAFGEIAKGGVQYIKQKGFAVG